MFHAVHLFDKAIVRRANEGCNEQEWEYGCRPMLLGTNSFEYAKKYIQGCGFDVLDMDEWSEFLNSISSDPEIVCDNSYVTQLRLF
jgi:hypothetical protein